jgi:hypothetical protein
MQREQETTGNWRERAIVAERVIAECSDRMNQLEWDNARLRAALLEIAAGSYPVPLNKDADAWRRLASMRKDIAQRALDHD